MTKISNGKSLEQRFWEKVEKGSPVDCWNWTAATVNGYGIIGKSGSQKRHQSHRLSWILQNGPIPDGMYILHSCDNRRCVNPSHLRAGTHLENMADMVARKRQGTTVTFGAGERNIKTKLTAEQVAKIRKFKGEIRVTHLAEIYGVSPGTIAFIQKGQTWKDL